MRCIQCLNKEVIPRLQKEGLFPEIDCYIQIRTAGIGESALAEKVEPLLENKEGLIIGYCAHAGIVDLRPLSSLDGDILSETELQNLADTCREALGEDFVCQGDRTLAEVIFRELRSLDKTLAVAESCTGGIAVISIHRDCWNIQSLSRWCRLLS